MGHTAGEEREREKLKELKETHQALWNRWRQVKRQTDDFYLQLSCTFVALAVIFFSFVLFSRRIAHLGWVFIHPTRSAFTLRFPASRLLWSLSPSPSLCLLTVCCLHHLFLVSKRIKRQGTWKRAPVVSGVVWSITCFVSLSLSFCVSPSLVTRVSWNNAFSIHHPSCNIWSISRLMILSPCLSGIHLCIMRRMRRRAMRLILFYSFSTRWEPFHLRSWIRCDSLAFLPSFS